METTFITIHDLSPDANILYTSDSIIDILGYSPDEVVNRSCWEFFHPEELPFAKARHGRGIEFDKAAVLSYCRMKGKDGRWLGCEVIFTVVYDCLVGCTSIYRRGLKSESVSHIHASTVHSMLTAFLGRAMIAPAIRRIFSTSPRDPRYHMLSHLSTKFSNSALDGDLHEHRSALFLNRYTRTLTIMYATNGLAETIGVTGEELRGKSFYDCIQQNCLQDAVRSLENAKANDSIAYLRFWFRDPRQGGEQAPRDPEPTTVDGDSDMQDTNSTEDESDQGWLREHGARFSGQSGRRIIEPVTSTAVSSTNSISSGSRGENSSNQNISEPDSRTSSADDQKPPSHEAIFGGSKRRKMSPLALKRNHLDGTNTISPNGNRFATVGPSIELEAVISCTSDGLVVCLRKAIPFMPPRTLEQQVAQEVTSQRYANGLFAAPWANDPILPPLQQRPIFPQHSTFAPSLAPAQAFHRPLKQPAKPSQSDFMDTIREIAIFAWAIIGINGSLADYGRGNPRGESQPGTGLPIWQPQVEADSNSKQTRGGHMQAYTANPSTSFAVEAPDNSGRIESRIDGNTTHDNRVGVDQPRNYGKQPHMVDGIDGAFNEKNNLAHNADGIDRLIGSTRQSKPLDNFVPKPSGRSSGFGFGDPGLKSDYSAASKLTNSNPQNSLKSTFSNHVGNDSSTEPNHDLQLPDGT